MNPEALSARYAVRAITDADTDAALRLMRSNPQYYRHCPPEPSEEALAHDRAALPPRNVSADKFYLGFWDGDVLVAVLDLILHCPNAETAFIGFFMTDAAYQGKGVGSALVGEICAALKTAFCFVRLMVVTTNEPAKRFWAKNDFEPTGLVLSQERYTVEVRERRL